VQESSVENGGRKGREAIATGMRNSPKEKPIIVNDIGERTTLCGNNATLSESSKEQLKVWLLEQALCWSLWIRRIGDDHIELVLVVVQEFEAVSDVDLDLGVLV
jgi:hypothetical protein